MNDVIHIYIYIEQFRALVIAKFGIAHTVYANWHKWRPIAISWPRAICYQSMRGDDARKHWFNHQTVCVTSATLCVNIDNVIDLYQVYIDICIYIHILLMINVKVCVSVWWYPGQKQRPQRDICIRHQHKFAFYHILCAVCHVRSCRTINTADMRNMYQ